MLSFILQIGNTVAATVAETLSAQPVTTGIETVTELPPNHLSLFEMVIFFLLINLLPNHHS